MQQQKAMGKPGNTEVKVKEEIKVKEENGVKANSNEPLKRKNEYEDGSPAKIKKKMPKNTQPKNALMRLNELKPGIQYNVESQEGPPHNPTFIVSIEVNGQKFTGRGHSKQSAKCAAAEAALASMEEFKNTSEAPKSENKNTSSCDFTTDEIENENSNFNQFGAGKQAPAGQNKTEKGKEVEEKNPVMLLNEVHPGTEFNLIAENTSIPEQRFTMNIVINGITFEGSGPNKKLAKAAAARSALCSLYGIKSECVPNPVPLPDTYMFPQATADKISEVIHKTFQEIMVGNTDYAKWKVLAGIVMTSDLEMSKIKIVGISTGTKGIIGKNISMNGACLNDCHAEILARRCLKNFLYYNLELIAVGQKDDSIFIANDGRNTGFRLKPGIKFHLYISTSPCGDARIFLPEEAAKDRPFRRPVRRARGVLRSKLENREGTMPIKSEDGVQNADAISQGTQKLITMSCSDKIASWNVLGIQGALLSCFVEPIYLESIIFGSTVHPGHWFRAMWGRFENSIEGLPKNYHLKKPRMCCVTNPEPRPLSKSPNFSVNWTVGFGRPEIINATTGKLESGEVSRLSKRSFFDHFIKLYGKIKSITVQNIKKKPKLYSEAKNSVNNYQTAKEELIKAFKNAGLGVWVRKPAEQDDFELVF